MRIAFVATLAMTLAVPGNAADSTAVEAPLFAEALKIANEMPRIHSLLVNHQGELVVEEYFHGRNRRQSGNVKSVSKSIMSALVGIAIDRGIVAGTEQEIGDYFNDTLPANDVKRNITVGQLLSMQAGLETTSFYNYGAWVLSDDWLGYALRQPALAQPGTRMIYSTGNTHILSGILTRATGGTTRAFAEEHLLKPLGITLAAWQTDPAGVYFGGNNMAFTPRDLLAFGLLFLHDGKANGAQIVSEDWVSRSTTRIVESGREPGRFYGLGWWSRDMANVATTYAWGYGGQFVMLVPELNLVVVATSRSDPANGSRRHTRALYNLLENQIIRPISERTVNTTDGERLTP